MKKAAKAAQKPKANGDYNIEVLTPVPAPTSVYVKVHQGGSPDASNTCCVGRIYPLSYPELSLVSVFGRVYDSVPGSIPATPQDAAATQGVVYNSVHFRFRADGSLLSCMSTSAGRDQWLVVWVRESSDGAGYYKNTGAIQFKAVSKTTTACGD